MPGPDRYIDEGPVKGFAPAGCSEIVRPVLVGRPPEIIINFTVAILICCPEKGEREA